ncbi:MAG: VWA domain-containing protein [Eubacterium sp.]|nr:VWA domain-containing protein [Eubacterium sp.]
MSMLEKVPPMRRICPILFLLDRSVSMDGAPLGAVNQAMVNIIPEFISMNQNNANVEIKFAVLSFGNGVVWETGEGLVSPENYTWKDIESDGATPMGEAFNDLEKVLHVENGFMKNATGSVAPVIFLLSDGEPTDNYKEGLKKLKDNLWFKVAAKVAVGYGCSNDAILEEYTGNKETVLHTNDPKDLQKMIRFVTITSSMVNSTGKAVNISGNNGGNENVDTTDSVAEALKTAKEELSDAVDPDDQF